jgi:hypothetical protein
LDTLFSNELDWSALSTYLKLTASLYPIKTHIEVFTDTGTFSTDGCPLLEDYMISGLVWAQSYFVPNRFEEHSEDDDRSSALKTDDNHKDEHHATRVLVLGMTLARQSTFFLPTNAKPNTSRQPVLLLHRMSTARNMLLLLLQKNPVLRPLTAAATRWPRVMTM